MYGEEGERVEGKEGETLSAWFQFERGIQHPNTTPYGMRVFTAGNILQHVTGRPGFAASMAVK